MGALRLVLVACFLVGVIAAACTSDDPLPTAVNTPISPTSTSAATVAAVAATSTPSAPASPIRVLALGDSYTIGQSVDKLEGLADPVGAGAEGERSRHC